MGIMTVNNIKNNIAKKQPSKSLLKRNSVQIHKMIQNEEEKQLEIDKRLSNEKVIRTRGMDNYIMNNKNELKHIRTRDINRRWNQIMDIGWLGNKQYSLGPFDGINGAWTGQPCFIIGSGPDLKIFIKEVGWEFLRNKNTIGINHVIESWDGFKWFFFLDRRFLNKTTYNLANFQGKVFAQNNTGIQDIHPDIVRFKCKSSKGDPSLNIADGLFSHCFSGLAALNLAVISGANPIFLIGFGMGKDGNDKQFHFRGKYQGVGQRPKEQYRKYLRVYNGFRKFKRWYPAIVHVTEGDVLAKFKKMDFATLKQKFGIKEVIQKGVNVNKGIEPKIVHLSFSDDINIHADITRSIINKCYGHHFLTTFKNVPWADLYITEHFISTNKFIQNFPYKNKTINIVHSMNCIPLGNWKCNVALTNIWAKFLRSKGVSNVKVIYGGIDLEPYKNIVPSDDKIFGRITRWSPGKIPFWWNRLVTDILNYDKEIKCLMFVNQLHSARQMMKHDRMIYDQSCRINDFKGEWLKKLSVYVHVNGKFKETMSHAVIEAMATGLPIIYSNEPAVSEVVGAAGMHCSDEKQLRETIIKFLYDKSLRETYGKLSKQRAVQFDINNTIKNFDKLIKEMV